MSPGPVNASIFFQKLPFEGTYIDENTSGSDGTEDVPCQPPGFISTASSLYKNLLSISAYVPLRKCYQRSFCSAAGCFRSPKLIQSRRMRVFRSARSLC